MRRTLATASLLLLQSIAAAASNDEGSISPGGPAPDPPQECPNDNSSTTRRSSSSVPSKLHCVNDTEYNEDYALLGNTFCLIQDPTSGNDAFYLQPALDPYQIAPILNHASEIASQYAFQMGLPPKLIETLLNYCDELGITDLMRDYTSHSPIPALDEHNGRYLKLQNKEWYAQRPASKWASDMHSISPANEAAHEDYLRVLMGGGFDRVLESIGNALGLDGLVAYHLTFIGVSYSSGGYIHRDATLTDGRVYNLIIPLLLEEESDAELLLISDRQEERRGGGGGYKYSIGTGVLMGDDAMYGMRECNYRNISNPRHGGVLDGNQIGMRLAATVYIADINEDNVASIAKETLTHKNFPLASEEWLMSQAGRHWRRDGTAMVDGDIGRKAFRFRDELDDCHDRMQRGFCMTDEQGTRRQCLKTCGVYIEEGPVSVHRLDDALTVCTLNRTGGEECKSFLDTDAPGQFVSPQLQPGEMFPIVWRDTNKIANEYAFQVGVPSELVASLLSYCDRLGITDLFRDLVGDNPIPAQHDYFAGRFVELNDGNRWYAQRTAKRWNSNMHWLSPADEKTHEEHLQILADGNFDLVLDAIGRYLGLEGLVTYDLGFIGLSYSDKELIHSDSTGTGASVYNVIIPLILEDNAAPELLMLDDKEKTKAGGLKYKIGLGAVIGDDAMHGTAVCDYRETKGMRLAFSAYIGDLNYNNVEYITPHTLVAKIFPLPDTRWLFTQAGRHWGDRNNNSLANDKGRKQFVFSDALMDCAKRAADGLCESGETTGSERNSIKV
jgi:hypothetical protein